MQLHKAKEIADGLVKDLTPSSDRISIAGSIRRERPEIGDVEIVLIRKKSELIYLMAYLEQYRIIKGTVMGKYMRLELPNSTKLDLFFCEKDNWGDIYFIRTGSYDWNIWFMTELRKNGYEHKEGRLYKGEEIIPCYEEEDMFKAVGLEFVNPPDRNPDYLRENKLI